MNILSSSTTKVLVTFNNNEEIPETIKHFDGDRNRTFKHFICHCGQHFYQRNRNTSPTCSTHCLNDKNRFEFDCAYCGNHNVRGKAKKANSRHGRHYCDRHCKELDQRLSTGESPIQPQHYGSHYSVNGYRLPAIREHGAYCHTCGYDEDNRMLDVHHRDGDRENNDLSNLEVLCVWCHALDTRKSWQPIPDEQLIGAMV